MGRLLAAACLILLAACGERSEPVAIEHGMRWSIAQRDLERNGWSATLLRPEARLVRAGGRGQAYRYRHASGTTYDIVTEMQGEVERVDRLFELDGREIPALPLQPAASSP